MLVLKKTPLDFRYRPSRQVQGRHPEDSQQVRDLLAGCGISDVIGKNIMRTEARLYNAERNKEEQQQNDCAKQEVEDARNRLKLLDIFNGFRNAGDRYRHLQIALAADAMNAPACPLSARDAAKLRDTLRFQYRFYTLQDAYENNIIRPMWDFTTIVRACWDSDEEGTLLFHHIEDAINDMEVDDLDEDAIRGFARANGYRYNGRRARTEF